MAESNDMLTGYLAGQSDSNNGGGGGGGFWNGDGIWAIILFAMIFGWGRGGFGGGFGGGNSGGGSNCGCGCGGWGFGGWGAPWATQADVRAAVDQQTLISKLDQQTYGLADSTYALNNTITNGFHGVDNAICNLGFNIQQGFNGVERGQASQGYHMQSGFNALATQLADCCCKTQNGIERGFADTNYNLATQFCNLQNTLNSQTRDIIDNQNANYRGLMDFMVQSKIDKLQSENEALRLRASQSEQNGIIRAAIDASTAEIIRRTGNDCPIPAYVVPNPNCCYGNPVGVGYASYGYGQRDGGCGCC